MHATLTRFRNHVVTGFIFIMPVLITVAVLMKFWNHLLKIGGTCSRLPWVDTVLGPSGDAVMAILLFLIICIVAGFLIRISFLRRMSERIDQRLNDLIPGYGTIRSQTTRKIGVDEKKELPFDACLVRVQDLWQPGYIIERHPDGSQTVFVPLAPAFATGNVYVVESDRIRKLDMDADALNARLKLLGKGILARTGVPGQESRSRSAKVP